MAHPKIKPPDEDDAGRDRRVYLELIDELRVDTAIVVANLKAQLWRLTAEKVERDTPNWQTLQRASAKAGCTYEWARAWAAKAIKADRSHEATKTAGLGISINSAALTAAYRLRR
jgi:hypothetical protein